MNNMGNFNYNLNSGGGFEPASDRLTASERAEINRQSNNKNYYPTGDMSMGHGCGNNSWMSNSNGSAMMMPRQQQNNLSRPQSNVNSNNMMTTTGTQSISFTPETLTNMSFLPAYLSQYVGHWVRADFFIGETIEQRVGVLHEVGASYFILEAIEPQTLLVCDMYSVKFVTIILDDDFSRLARF